MTQPAETLTLCPECEKANVVELLRSCDRLNVVYCARGHQYTSGPDGLTLRED